MLLKKLLLVSFAALALLTQPLVAEVNKLTVWFSPDGGCTEAISSQLARARSSILVQAYSFTSAPIAKSLDDAHKRGVRVEVLLDKSQRSEKYSSADFLLHAGIPTFIDARHAIAHNKIIIMDGSSVFTGSFNFTKAAEANNAENLLLIQNPAIAAQYTRNWNDHRAHAEPYTGKTEPAAKPRKRK